MKQLTSYNRVSSANTFPVNHISVIQVVILSEARHGKALKGLLERYFK